MRLLLGFAWVLCLLCLCTAHAPPEQDHYKMLGVSANAEVAEIRKKYKQLAKQYHPDKNPGNKEASDMFVKVSAAHEVLSDSKKRREYDQIRSGPGRHQQRRGNTTTFTAAISSSIALMIFLRLKSTTADSSIDHNNKVLRCFRRFTFQASSP